MCTHKEECHHIHCEPPDHEPACTNGQCSCHHAGSLHILTISLLSTCPVNQCVRKFIKTVYNIIYYNRQMYT